MHITNICFANLKSIISTLKKNNGDLILTALKGTKSRLEGGMGSVPGVSFIVGTVSVSLHGRRYKGRNIPVSSLSPLQAYGPVPESPVIFIKTFLLVTIPLGLRTQLMDQGQQRHSNHISSHTWDGTLCLFTWSLGKAAVLTDFLDEEDL